MTVERDIAGVAFPFAAGILAATLPTTLFQTEIIALASVSTALAGAGTLCLIHPSHNRWSSVTITSLILISVFFCGCLSGFTGRMMQISCSLETSAIPEWITSLAAGLKARIDAFPFKESSTNGIIAALITGDRTGIPAHIRSAFRDSGASHILALSGLHIGIIYGLLSHISSIAGNSPAMKRLHSVIVIMACGAYTLATGAGASITRAFLFIVIGETARLTGRYRSTASTLMAALIIQLTISPGSAGDIGFQLSYAAMSGIAFIFPYLRDLWPQDKGGPMKWIWNSAAMSISCQLTTGPLAYLYFGTFPRHFILTNLLALPAVGIIIPAGLLTAVLDSLGICPEILITVTEAIVVYMSRCLEIIASM